MTDPAPALAPRGLRLTRIGLLALASGLPFGLVTETIPVWLRSTGADLMAVGLVSSATLPWTLKFLWAPLVDRMGTRRAWIAACLVGIAAAVAVLRLAALPAPGPLFWVVLLGLVALSATQDIAIDAYTIESTTTRELGVANSVRIGAYRAAMFAGGGALVFVGGVAGWDAALVAAAALTLGLAAVALGVPEVRQRDEGGPPPLWAPVLALARRPGVGWVVAFVLLFKLGDAAMDPMTRPFWVDRGLPLTTIGATLTTARLAGTVAGAILGGVLTTRLGIFTALWSLGALQAVSNLGYAWAAATGAGTAGIVAVAVVENLTGGLGTAAFVAFLMAACDRRFAGTQYAVLSALLALTRAGAGAASGAAAGAMGYPAYFALTFALALPAFALLPRVRRWSTPDAATAPPPAA